MPDSLSSLLKPIKLADKTVVEALVKEATPTFVQVLSSGNNFVKEDAAAFIIQFFAAISEKGISPYTYGWWFNGKILQELAIATGNENSKIVCDYFAYSGPSFMKVIGTWEPHISLMPIRARVEDFSKSSIQQKEIIEIANDAINQEVIIKLKSIIEEKSTFQIFQKGVFNNKILTTFESHS